MNQGVGIRPTPCVIRSTAAGVRTVWGFTNLPAQTVGPGVWAFTMYWNDGSRLTNDTVTVTAGVSATASCAGFAATIPNAGTTWSTTFGAAGANTASPFTVSTSASQASLSIPAGGSLCLSVTLTHNRGEATNFSYDGTAGVADTRVLPPTIVVPESDLAFVGLALMIPVMTGRKRLLAVVRHRR
jgi:hypothetical protein